MDSTPRELMEMYQAKELLSRENWVIMRLQTLLLINSNRRPKNQIRDARRLIRFEWEKPPKEIKPPTLDDWQKADERLNKLRGNKYSG